MYDDKLRIVFQFTAAQDTMDVPLEAMAGSDNLEEVAPVRTGKYQVHQLSLIRTDQLPEIHLLSGFGLFVFDFQLYNL